MFPLLVWVTIHNRWTDAKDDPFVWFHLYLGDKYLMN